MSVTSNALTDFDKGSHDERRCSSPRELRPVGYAQLCAAYNEKHREHNDVWIVGQRMDGQLCSGSEFTTAEGLD